MGITVLTIVLTGGALYGALSQRVKGVESILKMILARMDGDDESQEKMHSRINALEGEQGEHRGMFKLLLTWFKIPQIDNRFLME